MNYLELHYLEEIKKFMQEVRIYCKNKNLEANLYNYINCDKKNYCNDNFKNLLSAPKIFLVCSKAFKDFYLTLDKDFQMDLISPELYVSLIQDLKQYSILRQQIQIILKDDFIGKTK